MTEQELKEIEARANAATPGPWSSISEDAASDYASVGPFVETAEQCETNCKFIAHARDDIPKLLAEVRTLAVDLDIWKAAYKDQQKSNAELWRVLKAGC